MVGGQHHRVVDPARVEDVEQATDGFVECVHLNAHLGAFGAERMANVIGRREADRKHVGRRAFAQIQLGDQLFGKIAGRGIEFGREAEAVGIAPGAFKASGADGRAADLYRAIVTRTVGRQIHRGAVLG